MRKQYETETINGKQCKVYGPNEYGEYLTRFYVGGKLMDGSDYFAPDCEDAISTADAAIAEETKYLS